MKKVKRPIKNGVAKKVPVVIQLEALECGAACLTMILAYYEKWIPLEQVRSDCGVSRDGSKAGKILKAARNYGFEAKGFKYDVEDLQKEAIFPCIIFWNNNHFVVLDGFKGNYAIINDPARGRTKYTIDAFEKSYSGIYLEFKPTREFKPEGKPKSVIKFAKKRLKGTKAMVLFTLITTIIASLLSIIGPGFSRIFIDRLLTHQNPEWFVPFIIGMCQRCTMKAGIMKVYYGNGKGKTMSAIGRGILEASEGNPVIVIQFLKSKNQEEMSFLGRLEPEFKLFRFEKSSAGFEELSLEQREEEMRNIRNGLNFARKVLTTGECGLLILDEVLGVLENGIITMEELAHLKELADETEVICTGTHASQELIDLADEVYRLEAVKE